MSNPQTFTEEELKLLAITPSLIGATISAAESSGIIGTVKEAMANARGFLGGATVYPDNTVIQAVSPNLEDRADAMEKAKTMRTDTITRLKEKGIDTKEALQDQVVADCRAVASILQSKASEQEAAQYKDWAMSIAEQVAMAATEGGFLGFGGERLSAGEVDAINTLATALDTDPPTTMIA